MRKKTFTLSLSLSFIFVFSFAILAQTSKPTPTPEVEKGDREDVVKISTTLIQLDVIVTDKKGNQVTDLKPEDFEIYENGKKQDITNFSYIFSNRGKSPADSSASTAKRAEKYSVPAPPTKLKLEQVRRTYALVVDDLGLSFENVGWVQQSLRKFVNEQMQEGDLVAIIRTGSGIGALQSFTSDKRQLLAAVSKIKWNSQGRGGISSFAAIEPDFKDELAGSRKANGNSGNPSGKEEDKEFQNQIEDFRNENFSVGTLGALSYIIRGMRDLPGRKSLMLVSEGFQLINDRKPTRVYDAMKVLADLANRSSVVVYTLDPRGLQFPGMATAEDDIGIVPPDAVIENALQNREANFADSQQSLRYLAYETGGIPYVNQNNIGVGLRKVLEDQNGYYLMGYQPDAETFDPKKNKFNNLTVKLKRDDLKIRYRSGFYGITDEKFQRTSQTPKQKLTAALISPFGANDVNLNLYSIFYNDNRDRNFIRSLVYIDTKDLTFTPDADGFYQAKFDIIAMVFDSNGAAAGNNINSHTLKLTKEQLAKIREKGLIYDLPVPVIKTGAYQFRVALQDTATGKIGAASQFIEIPNLARKKLTLSNLIVKQYSLEEWKKLSLGQKADSDQSGYSALLDTVIRKFKRGTIFTYSFVIYNAKADSSRKPQLQLQTRLFRDGKMILESNPFALDVDGQKDLQRLEISNAVTLGTDLQPGDYAFQIIVSDGLAKEKKQIAFQSIDFEIIR